jgi:hypothetical protein
MLLCVVYFVLIASFGVASNCYALDLAQAYEQALKMIPNGQQLPPNI